ncbi:HDL235Cp [Eremothecium sinecaudum]|uniref:HDL235Cp n=1 Tax=Eremothecium sinecaudum TaxID=45286 RepID=A0A0X8HS94_9SACH|nr:HDL235Cp [Eremothecium sinecaudum]AMD20509.1 HDL235Cp [Eremothecium sinecaudum]
MDDDSTANLVERIKDAGIANQTSKISDIEARELELQYERQQKAVQELLHKQAFVPVQLSNTIVEGAESIRPNVLQRYLDRTVYTASNLNQLLRQTDVLFRLLVSSSLAESITQTLDTRGSIIANLSNTQIPSYLHENEGSNAMSVIDIVQRLKIQPVKKFAAKTGTNVGNGEGDGYLQFQWRNVFGGGERIVFDATKGTKTQSSYLLSLIAPVNEYWIGDLSSFKQSARFGGVELFTRGIRTSVKSLFFLEGSWNHELAFESIWRSTLNKNINSSDSVLIHCGEDLKNSITHKLVKDTRDNVIFPNSGYSMQLLNEISLGSYWKLYFEANAAQPLGKDDFFTMSSSIKAGYISNFHPQGNIVHFKDKFHSGGPNDVRGFQLMGLGPKDRQDALGGDALLAYGVSIFSRLPISKWSSSGFRLHYFINGGRLINHNNASKSSILSNMLQQHSISTGAGLVFKHPAARFELNFTLPLTAHLSDSVRKGFQYGIGISFL